MPRKYTKITPQIVAKAKKYLDDPRGFKKIEICRLLEIGENSLNRIIQGYYDQPPAQQNKETQMVDSSPSPDGKNVTEIPFEDLETMMRCRMFVEELFEIAIISDKAEDELYFPRHKLANMCNRYFPQDVEETLKKLRYDTNA